MSIWVRYLAWLNATPRPDPRSKAAKREDLELVSRFEQMRRQGIKNPVMPPNPATHITDRLVEMGLSEAAGMGVVPLSWREIGAWCERTGIDLPPWESRLMRRLSADYVGESRRGENESCPPPWLAPANEATIAAEIRLLDAILG